MDKQPIPLNPTVLRWAREEAGLSLEEAAERARVKPPRQKRGETHPLTPADRLQTWENGCAIPSLSQLEAIAAAYRRPLLTFFLPTPPAKQASLADFRTVGSVPTSKDTPEFAAFKRRLEALHQDIREILEMERPPHLPFVGVATNNTPPSQIVHSIRMVLDFQIEEQQRLTNSDQLIKALRDRAHSAGIFVLFEGNLGSHHSNISPEEFRGICFSNRTAPLVVINPNDAKAAQLFTFVHELGHLWLGDSGVSNLDGLSSGTKQAVSNVNERLCNKVAAEFLVPESLLRSAWDPDGDEGIARKVDLLSRHFKVSREVIARRLLDINKISQDEYSLLRRIYSQEFERRRQQQKASGGAPSRNTMDKIRLGERLLRTVTTAAFDGKITLQDAARILSVPVSRFSKVL